MVDKKVQGHIPVLNALPSYAAPGDPGTDHSKNQISRNSSNQGADEDAHLCSIGHGWIGEREIADEQGNRKTDSSEEADTEQMGPTNIPHQTRQAQPHGEKGK